MVVLVFLKPSTCQYGYAPGANGHHKRNPQQAKQPNVMNDVIDHVIKALKAGEGQVESLSGWIDDARTFESEFHATAMDGILAGMSLLQDTPENRAREELFVALEKDRHRAAMERLEELSSLILAP